MKIGDLVQYKQRRLFNEEPRIGIVVHSCDWLAEPHEVLWLKNGDGARTWVHDDDLCLVSSAKNNKKICLT